jgi:hypothetical protein
MRVGLLFIIGALALSCTRTPSPDESSAFTKADTITDQLLVLQDSLHHRWLQVSIHEQLHTDHLAELFSQALDWLALPHHEQAAIHNQILQLRQLQLNPRNMTNPDVIREHDLARHALTTDIFRIIERHELHLKDSGIADLARKIQELQEATWPVRITYDSLAHHYNQYLLQHEQTLTAHDPANQHAPRPLFRAVLK